LIFEEDQSFVEAKTYRSRTVGLQKVTASFFEPGRHIFCPRFSKLFSFFVETLFMNWRCPKSF